MFVYVLTSPLLTCIFCVFLDNTGHIGRNFTFKQAKKSFTNDFSARLASVNLQFAKKLALTNRARFWAFDSFCGSPASLFFLPVHPRRYYSNAFAPQFVHCYCTNMSQKQKFNFNLFLVPWAKFSKKLQHNLYFILTIMKKNVCYKH